MPLFPQVQSLSSPSRCLLEMCQSAYRKDHNIETCCAECSWLPISEGGWEACHFDCHIGPQHSIQHTWSFHSSGDLHSFKCCLSSLHPMSITSQSVAVAGTVSAPSPLAYGVSHSLILLMALCLLQAPLRMEYPTVWFCWWHCVCSKPPCVWSIPQFDFVDGTVSAPSPLAYGVSHSLILLMALCLLQAPLRMEYHTVWFCWWHCVCSKPPCVWSITQFSFVPILCQIQFLIMGVIFKSKLITHNSHKMHCLMNFVLASQAFGHVLILQDLSPFDNLPPCLL